MAARGDDELGELKNALGDRAISAGAGNWFARADESQKLAIGAIVAAATLGPLGQGFLAAIKVLYSSKLPNSEQLQAVVWLAVLTLPVFAAATAGLYFAGKTAGGAVLAIAAAASVAGSWLMGKIGVPKQLGDLYCYNDGQALERLCREFDTRGFTSEVQSAKGSSDILSIAFSYTADARGVLMAACGAAAGVGCGYLLRRETENQ